MGTEYVWLMVVKQEDQTLNMIGMITYHSKEKKIQFQEDPTLKSKEGLPLNKTGLIILSLEKL